MCDFVSWIEYDGRLYYLTKKALGDKKGKAIYKDIKDDICGHGAIRRYYDIPDGKGSNLERTNFLTSDNFPVEIAKTIKNGMFRGIGLNLDLLNKQGIREYEQIEQPAWAEYKRIKQPAWAEYDRIEQPAWAEYKRIEQPAWAEYDSIKQASFWEIFSKKKYRNPAWK